MEGIPSADGAHEMCLLRLVEMTGRGFGFGMFKSYQYRDGLVGQELGIRKESSYARYRVK